MTNASMHPNGRQAYRRAVVFCMLALLLSFACLAPGGPIENRDFSHLSDSVFWGFNVFLIALWLAGSAAVYFIWKGRRGAYLSRQRPRGLDRQAGRVCCSDRGFSATGIAMGICNQTKGNSV